MHYLKDKKNLLSYYKNNFKDIIDARKNGVYYNYDNIDSEDEEPLENNYYGVKSENDIILTKKKTPVFIQKILNPNYHSFYLKQKSYNTKKPSKRGKNKNKSAEKYKKHSKAKKNSILKKKKSKIKLSNINSKREKYKGSATTTNKSLLDNNIANTKLQIKNKIKNFNLILKKYIIKYIQ